MLHVVELLLELIGLLTALVVLVEWMSTTVRPWTKDLRAARRYYGWLRKTRASNRQAHTYIALMAAAKDEGLDELAAQAAVYRFMNEQVTASGEPYEEGAV